MNKRAFIPISALMGALLLALVATMTPFVAERNLAYAQTDSDIATLSALRVSTGTLMPAFDPNALSGAGEASDPHAYTVNVRNGVSSLTVTAIRSDSRASVAFSGGVGTTGRMSLIPGTPNVLTITVTAENGTTTKVYQVTVNRASVGASNDATLSVLSVTPYEDTTSGTAIPLSNLDKKFGHTVDLTNAQDGVTVSTTAVTDAVVTVKKGGKTQSDPANTSIDMAVGDNTITVEVLAPDYATTRTYTLTINRARVNASEDARLSSLGLSNGMLMPAFDMTDLPGDGTSEAPHAFAVRVPHTIFEVTVMAETNDRLAKWVVWDTTSSAPATDSNSNQNGHQVDVSSTADAGTIITIRVTAEDRLPTNQKFYQVTVNRASVSASHDATLSALSVTPYVDTTSGTAIPLSDLDEKFAHTVELTSSQDGVTVSATAVTGAVVTVKKGDKTQSDPANTSIDMDVGDNMITVEVLAPDYATMQTYTLTINRARANASDDARLSSLSLSDGMLMPSFDMADLPDNDNDATNNDDAASGPGVSAANAHPYTARVPNSVESLTVTAPAMNSGAMVKITSDQDSSVSEGEVDLVVGANVIAIEVTAENRTTQKFYQITVTRASSGASNDATLSALSVTPYVDTTSGTAIPLSDLDEKFAHTVELTSSQDGVTVSATAVTGAVVTVKKGDKTQSDPANTSIDMDVGDNMITVEVLAPDYATMQTYTLTINRARANASDDARLSSLSLSDGMLMPSFDAGNLADGADGTAAATAGTATASAHAYTARVPNSVESLTVTAAAMSSGAMVKITSDQDSSVSEGEVDLVVGANVIAIEVTAENRTTQKFYQITVTRVAAAASSNAALSDLSLATEAADDTDPSLNPAFDTASLPALTGGAHHFSASVSRGTSEIRVIPVKADSDATITVMSNGDDTVTMVTGSDPAAYAVDLQVGDNVVTVMVAAENVITTKTYKITITRAGIGNAALSDLSLSDISLNETFGTAAGDAYTANVASSVNTTVMATPVQSNANIDIMPDDADPEMDGHQVALAAGTNTITVTVTAGSSTRVYTVTVAVPSDDATLSEMSLTDSNGMAVMLYADIEAHWNTLDCPQMNDWVGADDQPDNMSSPYCRMYAGLDADAKAVVDASYPMGFSSNINMYTAMVGSDVDSVTVSAMATHSGAMVSGDGSHDLMVGDNTVTVMVTTEDGTMMDYTVMVTVVEELTDEQRLLAAYDMNGDGAIDDMELNRAIDAYLDENLSDVDLNILIDLYLG